MNNPALIFEICAIDLDRLSKFYFEVFGWQGSEGEGAGFIPFAPAVRPMWGVVIKAQLGKFGWEKGITFYIQVEHLETTLEKIETNGGFVAVAPKRSQHMASALPCSKMRNSTSLALWKSLCKREQCCIVRRGGKQCLQKTRP